MPDVSILKSLKEDTRIVASARFNKVKRLKRKTWWSLFSISFISIALILVTICENTHKITLIKPVLFFDITIQSWVVTVLSSIVTLSISIAISSAKLEVEQEKLNDSAIRINNISGLIVIPSTGCSKQEYIRHFQEYQNIIHSNPINHDDIDHKIAKHIIKNNIAKSKKTTDSSPTKSSFLDKVYFTANFYVIQNIPLIPYIIISYLAFSVTVSVLRQILVTIC